MPYEEVYKAARVLRMFGKQPKEYRTLTRTRKPDELMSSRQRAEAGAKTGRPQERAEARRVQGNLRNAKPPKYV